MNAPLDSAILDFYARLPQQGPGSDADAEAALRPVLDRLPPAPMVADLGCGTGRSTLFLAERLGTRVTAVELAGRFCERLAARAAQHGLSALVDIRCGDMASPPVEPASLDLIWSEGAAYIIGFAEALRRWRPLLRAGGWCVVSECSWLARHPPEPVARFFAAGYPEMASVAGNIARAQAAGYDVLATHIVSAAGWEQYYDPIRRAIRDGETGALDPAFIDELEAEISLFERSKGSYGYVFYVLGIRG